MKIAILYFSGTGNTKWIVDSLSQMLIEEKQEVSLYSLNSTFDINSINIREADMVGVAYPIYCSKAPLVVRSILDKLPEVEGISIFYIATAGYVSGDVNLYTHKIMENKGYKICLSANFVMGNNLHLPILSPLHVTSLETMKSRTKLANKKLKKICKKIIDQDVYIEGSGVFSKIYGAIQRLRGKKHADTFFHGFYVNEKCNRCGWCIRSCPTRNITEKNGKLIFGDKCILCMKCYNYCPKSAIQTSSKTENLKKYKRYKGPDGLKYKSK
jgi:ferredoxin